MYIGKAFAAEVEDTIMKNLMRCATTTAILLAATAFAYGQAPLVILSGQNPVEWNKRLGVNATRGSCNLSPEACMKQAEDLMRGQQTNQFYRNLQEDPNTILSYAAYDSQASVTDPRLVEVALDDFTDHFNGWCKTPKVRCDQLLAQVIATSKSKNKNLKFGLTLYEDQLSSLFANPHFTPALRAQIDLVHLYIHQRQNGPRYASYVAQVKQNLPNAQVIAGAYPFDRVDYIKCGNGPCSAAQEQNYYKQTLQIQLNLLKDGSVVGLELYPGYFGREDKWPHWNEANICSPNRKQECIDSTKAMDQVTVQMLNQAGIGTP